MDRLNVWCRRWLCLVLGMGCAGVAVARTLRELPRALTHAHFRLIPLPIIATDPTEGQTYGGLPVVITLDPNEEILAVLAGAFTYNNTTKWGGFGNFIFSPSVQEELRVYGGAAQRFYREVLIDYSNRAVRGPELQVNVHGLYLEYPFERFFGFGPKTGKSAESNFTSRIFRMWGEASYEFRPDWMGVAQLDWASLVMNPAALPTVADTSATYGADAEVSDSNQAIYRVGLRYDSRDSLTSPTEGLMGQALGIYAHATDGRPTSFGGYELRGKGAWQPHRRVTLVGNLRWQQLFGARIPFSLQSSLGGNKELRGFMNRRFVDHHLALAEMEARILVKQWHLFGTDVAFSLDPFVSVGQVFRQFGQLKPANLDPTGGVGLRMSAKPAVLGRVDLAYGRDGFTVYTTLDYPF